METCIIHITKKMANKELIPVGSSRSAAVRDDALAVPALQVLKGIYSSKFEGEIATGLRMTHSYFCFTGKRVVLASNSPRRKEILASIVRIKTFV